ncbi:hypothetical protein [Desertihabitans aurantiacus]|uniref:hypothetical protein n=1 Tax=Desertihabitans aurantiacus TaxID=2282477 RepID=UPI000DF77B1F|nr:hypothetical protein [Desertihabitans aurantiacus]
MGTVRLLGAVTGAALTLLLTVAPPATGRPPTRVVNTVDELSCAFATTTGEGLFIQAGAGSASGESGSGFFLEDADGVVVLAGEGGTARFGPEFTAEIEAVRPGEEQPVGTVTLTARLTAGTPVVEQVDERDGNIRTTGTVTTTEYAFSDVAVDVPGYEVVVDELSCDGSRIDFDLLSTNPSAHVVRSRDFGSDICTFAGTADTQVRLSGEDRSAPYAEVVVDDGVNPLKAQGEIGMRGLQGTLVAPLTEIFTGETVATLTLRLRLVPAGPPTTTVERDGRALFTRTETPYLAELSLTTTDGRRGEVSCPASEVLEGSITPRR